VEYAHRHLEEYDHVLWVAAQSREALDSGYSTIAGILKVPLADAKDQTLAVNGVKHWLSSHERWLLILDNADDRAVTREFIPPGKNGHVLLTTRATAVGTIAQGIGIQEMGTEEGALLLLRRAKRVQKDALLEAATEADQRTAKEIATQLDGLPLALDQAAAYIEETSCGLSGYLDLYRKHAPELLRRRGVLTSDHLEPVATTWVLSFEKIEKTDPIADELLRFCAFLYPDGIPEEMFTKGALELGPLLGSAASNALIWNDAISEILKYSLLRRDPNTHTIEIHRLVQAVLKQGMDEAIQRLWSERAVRAVKCAFPKVEFSTWDECERLLPQAQACAELINQWSFEFSDAAQLLNQAGLYLSKRGRYTDIEPLYKRALAIWEKALGPEHPKVATSLNNLVELYRAQGQYAEAEPLSKRALAIREKALEAEHPDVATSLNNLALLYRAQGRYTEAEPLASRALAIRKKVRGQEHPDVAASLNNLALLYRAQGRYAEAEPLSKRALAIREKVLGPEHPFVANGLNTLAQLYYDQSRYGGPSRCLSGHLRSGNGRWGPTTPTWRRFWKTTRFCYEPWVVRKKPRRLKFAILN